MKLYSINAFLKASDDIGFLRTFLDKFSSICTVDLTNGTGIALKSIFFSGDHDIPWNTILVHYLDHGIYPDDRSIIAENFSLDAMQQLIDDGSNEKSVKVREFLEDGRFIWVEASATVISREKRTILVTSRNINKQKIWESIVERFVFKNCDYFVLIDIHNNCVDRFMSKDDGTDAPPEHSDDYSGLIESYNREYAMPYDAERLTDAMRIENMVEMLEQHDEFSIYIDSTMLTESGMPQRKWLQFAYHDKQRGLIMVSRSDITEIYQQEKQRSEQLNAALIRAQTDAMTGLFNHMATVDYLRRAFDEGLSNAAVMFIDVDNFKMVNDTQGHQAGDHLLTYMAQSLTKMVGESGIVGRVGGDEFLAFLPGNYQRERLDQIAESICNLFSSNDFNLSGVSQISCSVGISCYPDDGQDCETLIRNADKALYQSKRQGKKRHIFYSKTDSIYEHKA